ncbi:DNA-binding transcriptional MerR regulator [Nonomuraea thailandensis]|uniref:DNA-binding transcriptional MerR regulator n=2 Tax=Nonomuraea thailandensis TaxID=1188745 RepID=A0A9X2GZL7_9ACTN|nr:MerR family transcriptional regulator [Nonomuraea thailandensis]MCP2363268.1 DNA-binding transcriptional MerR regulator [Nonomuraea thailandensis]
MSGMSIGQVAERTGLSVHTLRFYEREGLLAQPVRRGSAGHRVYSEGDVDWLGVCMRLRASGMPLTDIRRYTELVRAGQGNEVERLRVLREHRERVLAQMHELDECLALITHKVAIYEGRLGLRDEVPDCVPRA